MSASAVFIMFSWRRHTWKPMDPSAESLEATVMLAFCHPSLQMQPLHAPSVDSVIALNSHLRLCRRRQAKPVSHTHTRSIFSNILFVCWRDSVLRVRGFGVPAKTTLVYLAVILDFGCQTMNWPTVLHLKKNIYILSRLKRDIEELHNL